MWREDWGCAAGVPEVVGLRGAEVAEEEMFARCLSLLASLWIGRGEETRERKEEGKEGNGATVEEEGESKGELNSYSFVMGVCTRNWLFSDESLSTLSCSIRIVLCQGGQVGGRQWNHAVVTN